MDAVEIIKAAQAKGDETAREALPVVAMKDCRRCKGTGGYTYASGARGICASCYGGKVPATKAASATVQAFKADRELRRLRIVWAGYRDAFHAATDAHMKDDCRRTMKDLEAMAAAVKTDPRVAM